MENFATNKKDSGKLVYINNMNNKIFPAEFSKMRKEIMPYLMLVMFIFSCITVLLLSLYSSLLVESLTNEMEINIEARLKETSKRGASMVTASELAEYQKPEDMNLPGFQDLRNKLQDLSNDTGLLYVYYLRADEKTGKMQFIIDNGFNEVTRVGLNTPPVDIALVPGLKEALSGSVASATLGHYKAGLKGLLSAYAPIFDAEGRVAAVCGVDFNDEMIVSTKRMENLLRSLKIAAVFIVFASGILCLIGYRRKARIARESNVFKSKFLTSLGHEMRSPLSAMSINAQLAAELLDSGVTSNTDIVKEIRAALFAVKDEADRLARMSGAAIALGAEQSSHKIKGEKSILDMVHLFRVTCEIYRPMLERRGNNLVVNIPNKQGEIEEIVFVNGNADELSEVLINFISNANEHTRNGEIRVTVSHEADFVTITVSDNGEGIEERALSKIFERRFYKDASGKTGGIGLSICREIIEDHSGQIGIKSSPGKGTSAYFRLPVVNKGVEGEQ